MTKKDVTVDAHRLEGRASQEILTSAQSTRRAPVSLDGVSYTDTGNPNPQDPKFGCSGCYWRVRWLCAHRLREAQSLADSYEDIGTSALAFLRVSAFVISFNLDWYAVTTQG